MCITGYGTMENPIHSLWKSKNSFPTSCKQGFPQFHERSQLYDISTMPAPTESISLSISFIKTFFYRSIPALSAKSAFRPISIDCFSSGRRNMALLHNLTPKKSSGFFEVFQPGAKSGPVLDTKILSMFYKCAKLNTITNQN